MHTVLSIKKNIGQQKWLLFSFTIIGNNRRNSKFFCTSCTKTIVSSNHEYWFGTFGRNIDYFTDSSRYIFTHNGSLLIHLFCNKFLKQILTVRFATGQDKDVTICFFDDSNARVWCCRWAENSNWFFFVCDSQTIRTTIQRTEKTILWLWQLFLHFISRLKIYIFLERIPPFITMIHIFFYDAWTRKKLL